MTHWIKKFNPYHDDVGRFSSADGAGTGDGSYRVLNMDAVRSNPGLFQHAVNSVGDAITPPESLTQIQQNALMNYAHRGFYERINRPLRKGVPLTEMHDFINPYTNSAHVVGMMSAQDVVQALDSAIAEHTLPENTTLFRGLNNWPKAFGVDSEDRLVGMTFHDKGFVSTTIEKSKAVEFGSFVKDPYDTVVQIQAPKGTHAVAMVPNFTDEEEVILARDSQFKIMSVEHTTVSDTHGFKHSMRKIIAVPIQVSKGDGDWVTLAKDSGNNRYTWSEGDIQVMVAKDAGVAGDNDAPASPAINGPGFSWRKLPEQVQTNKKRKLIKYAATQERDDHGRFMSEGVEALFADSLGIKRADMPQIPNGPMKDKFMAELKGEGVSVTREDVPARDLKPTQKEFNKANIAHLREEHAAGRLANDGNPIVVSQDNRVLDGHHRWVVLAQADYPIHTLRIGLPIKALLARAAKFNAENSIQARNVHQTDFRKSDLFDLDIFESLDTVIKDDPSGNDPTQLYSSGGRPKWMQSPGQGGVDPVYRSQKPCQGGNQDTSFSKNINENPPKVIPVDPDGYYLW